MFYSFQFTGILREELPFSNVEPSFWTYEKRY